MLIKQLYNPFNSLMPRQSGESLRSQVTALVDYHKLPIKAGLFGCHHCRTSLSCTHYWSINCTKLAHRCASLTTGDFHVMWSCHISGLLHLYMPEPLPVATMCSCSMILCYNLLKSQLGYSYERASECTSPPQHGLGS
jgi:hypothetical protein